MRELIITLIFIGIIATMINVASTLEGKRTPVVNSTVVMVENKDTINCVDVWLTIGAPDKTWVNSVHGIFGIKTKGLQGKFTLKPKQTLSYIPKKGIQGNICFLTTPQQCNGNANGSTIIEFCLNNYNVKIPEAQETVEISCVSGITYIASIDMKGGKGIWTANYAGYDTITHIQNDTFGKNSGNAGVYPYGCDDCDSIASPPVCTIGKNETPQKYAICNIQRNASLNGGTVKISFISKVND